MNCLASATSCIYN